MKKIPENVVIVVKAVVPLFVVIILFFILGNLGINKISQILNQISAANKDKLVLVEKLDLLRKVSVTGTSDSNVVTSALPDTSPALAVMSQLRNMAAGSGLILTSAKVIPNSESSSDLKNIAINFNISGQKVSVNRFLLDLNTLAPITILDELKVSELNGVYEGDVIINSYWSPLPTQLPATLEGFIDLTEDDKKILTTVNNLTQPTFLDLSPVENSDRTNPFIR